MSTPVLRLSGTSRRGTPPKNANASTCAAVHAGLVHPQHRPHEHVPRTRQHHHERPHPPPPPGRRVDPRSPDARSRSAPPHPAVGLVAQHHAPGRGGPPRAGSPRTYRLNDATRRRQAVLVAQPLMDRRLRHPGLAAARRCSRDARSISGHVTCRNRVSASCGNQRRHQRRPVLPRPSPARPAPAPPPPPAPDTYGSSCDPPPGLSDTSLIDRPAYQWIKISVTSTTSKRSPRHRLPHPSPGRGRNSS